MLDGRKCPGNVQQSKVKRGPHSTALAAAACRSGATPGKAAPDDDEAEPPGFLGVATAAWGDGVSDPNARLGEAEAILLRPPEAAAKMAPPSFGNASESPPSPPHGRGETGTCPNFGV